MSAIEKLINELKTPNLPVIIEESNQINGEIFAFMGMGNEGNGTSTTVVELAKRLSAGASEKRILIIDFNIVEPELEELLLEQKKSTLSLDQIYNQANSGKISGRDIVINSSLYKGTNNLFFITGTRLNYLADHFDVEIMRAVLQACRQEFEYIFVDAPGHFDNAAIVASVIESDVLTYVTDFNCAGLRLFNNTKNAIYETHPEVLEKIRILGIEKGVKGKTVSPEVIEEVLGIEMGVIIRPLDDFNDYCSSLDNYLGSMELECPIPANSPKPKSFVEKIKTKLNKKHRRG